MGIIDKFNEVTGKITETLQSVSDEMTNSLNSATESMNTQVQQFGEEAANDVSQFINNGCNKIQPALSSEKTNDNDALNQTIPSITTHNGIENIGDSKQKISLKKIN